jgi:hypothetical protein
MTTISSLNVATLLPATSPSNATGSAASTSSVASQDSGTGSASAIVTIPSPGGESLTVYTPQGTLEDSGPVWAQSNTDAVSSVMADDYLSASLSGQFNNLGSALLDRFNTSGANFSQSVTVPSAGGASGLASLGNNQAEVKLTVQTASGVTVEIDLDSGNGQLGVSVKSSGALSAADRNALASLANGFQQAINGLTANPLGPNPTSLDLSGLLQYNPAVLSSVNLQFSSTGGAIGGVSADFSENGSKRSVSFTDATGSLNLSVDAGNSGILSGGTQQSKAMANYLKQFDNANAEGHGNAAMMAIFKDAFTQLMGSSGTSSQQPSGILAQSEQAMLTGLSDFSASLDENTSTVGSPGSFSYQVSQSTQTTGTLTNGTVTQTQQAILKANYREQLASGQGYDDVTINDNASSTVKLTAEQGILTKASLSKSDSQSTRNQEYVGGKLVSDTTTPTNTSDSENLLAMLTPFINDGEAASDSSGWQQALSKIHGMILPDAGED